MIPSLVKYLAYCIFYSDTILICTIYANRNNKVLDIHKCLLFTCHFFVFLILSPPVQQIAQTLKNQQQAPLAILP